MPVLIFEPVKWFLLTFAGKQCPFMIRAEKRDRELVTDILARSFNDNKSVNYIVKQDCKRERRLRSLMAYSFDICYLFGEIFLSDDKKGCALVLFPDQKKITPLTIFLNLKLIISCVGISQIQKVLQREALLKKHHPKEPMYYLWFLEVDPGFQNQGIGSELLQSLLYESNSVNRPVYLETSVERNIPWYQKFGFKIYHQLNFTYPLYCMKRE